MTWMQRKKRVFAIDPKRPDRDLGWSWFFGQSEGDFKVYSGWLIVPSMNKSLPLDPIDFNTFRRSSAGW